jgi:hypothetical protein
MGVPPPEHLHVRDRMPGTVWRAARPFLIFLLLCVLAFAFYSVGVALATNDKCGSEHLNTQKEWTYFPPQWECKSTLPGVSG